jgi:hypothetical protein
MRHLAFPTVHRSKQAACLLPVVDFRVRSDLARRGKQGEDAE